MDDCCDAGIVWAQMCPNTRERNAVYPAVLSSIQHEWPSSPVASIANIIRSSGNPIASSVLICIVYKAVRMVKIRQSAHARSSTMQENSQATSSSAVACEGGIFRMFRERNSWITLRDI
jgi:hypothetical protein